MNLIHRYSNKEVSFRYNGKNLYFFLSQSLFSSFDIDRGSRLLLKTLVKPDHPIPEEARVLDIGCGTGVIGISLKAAFPSFKVTMQDRDALAVYFTGENARRNSIDNVILRTGLAFQNLPGKSYDLIVSNLPAKAGAPVLKEFISKALAFLSGNGLCAVVVVSPLKAFIGKTVKETGGEIVFSEDTADYSVFHFVRKAGALYEGSRDFSLIPYIRTRENFKAENIGYSLETAYNLPGFDTLPYDALLTAYLAGTVNLSGNIFFWNPGQGHIPMIILSKSRSRAESITLASRDTLQLEISALNCEESNPGIPVKTFAEPDLLAAAGAGIYEGYVINLTGSGERKLLPALLSEVLKSASDGGILAITGKSSILSEISGEHRGWKLKGSKKYRGFRILIFKKGK